MKKKLPTPQKLPSGMWRCQIMVDGKRVSVVDEDPSVAQAKAVALRAKIIDEEKKKPEKKITLSDAIKNYVALKEGVLSPSTIRGYETMRKNRFQQLMGKNVYTITKKDVQEAVSDEVKKISAKTVYNAYGLIRPVLKEYGVNVFGVKLPQCVKPIKKYLQPDDIKKLIAAASGDSCETEILIAAWLGLRRSEIIGLCWDCVDFKSSTITIRRSVVPDKNNKWVLKEIPKNKSSQRTISCPEYIMGQLRALHTEDASGQIFKIHPDTLRKHIHRVCAKAGITDTTVHGLRHTNAAVMKSLGIDDAHAMARGGWSSESTYKKTYSYVFEQNATEADKSINNYFEKMHTKLHT